MNNKKIPDKQQNMSTQVGNYSVSVRSFFGTLKPNKNDRAPLEIEKKRKKTLKPILHPIFEKCANLADDKYWQAIFMDCARGKFPRGFTYKNNLITFRKANKLYRLEISNLPSDVYSSTIEFFNTTKGMMSAQDRKRVKKLEEEKLLEKLNSNTPITWKDIKTEKMKDILICEFIETLAEKLQLGIEDKKELVTTIKKGFMLKYFTGSNIEMENGRISEIDGLICDVKDGTVEISIDPVYMTRRPTRQFLGLGIEKNDDKPQINFLDIWTKYLTSLENKRNNKTYSSSQYNDESYNSQESNESHITDYSLTS